MYDTIRFYQGFTFFNHYILSVGLCLCGHYCSMCVPVCAWEWVCAYECVCKWVCLCVYVCDQDCRYSTFYFFLFSLPLSCFVPLTVFILSSVFKIISPPLTVLFAMILIFTWTICFLFWTSAIQRKCCFPDFDSRSVHCRSAVQALHWVSFYYLILIWEHKVFQ